MHLIRIEINDKKYALISTMKIKNALELSLGVGGGGGEGEGGGGGRPARHRLGPSATLPCVAALALIFRQFQLCL